MSGRYEVGPGLVRFGQDFGNGPADGHLFQIDGSFERYRAEKLAARAERLGKHYLVEGLSEAARGRVTGFIARTLAGEHPDSFRFESVGATSVLHCDRAGQALIFDDNFELADVSGREPDPPYMDALDALACQVQEDLAVVTADDGGHRLAALHVCMPSAWVPQQKVGGTFASIHEPVARAEAMNRRGDALVRAMIEATDGMVRFVWGVTTDERLNHHPQPPAGTPASQWRRRPFNLDRPRAFVRVERQTMWGFPDVGAGLFTIRTYLTDCAEIRRDRTQCDQLCAAIESMSPEALAYKGLSGDRDALLRWLRK
jgi:hypothetical protein